MTRESEVPIDLERAFSDVEGEMSFTKPLAIFPPERWPDCPDCGSMLTLTSVATDGKDNLIAARMICHNHQGDPLYVYEEATGNVYFDRIPEVVPFSDLEDVDE